MRARVGRAVTMAFLLVIGLGSVAFLIVARNPGRTNAGPRATADPSVVIGPGTVPQHDLELALDYFGTRFCVDGTLANVTQEASADATQVLTLEAGNDNLQGLLDAHKSGGDTLIYDVVLAGSCESIDPPGRTISGAEMQFFFDDSGHLVVSDVQGSYSGSEATPSPPFGDQFIPCESYGGCADPSPADSPQDAGA